MTSIKLPSIETFASGKRGKSPFEKFHLWVAKRSGGLPKGKVVNVSATKLHYRDYQKLRKLAFDWIKIQRPSLSYQHLQATLSWHDLEIGPASWKRGSLPKGTRAGFAYVDTAELFSEAT